MRNSTAPVGNPYYDAHEILGLKSPMSKAADIGLALRLSEALGIEEDGAVILKTDFS